MKRKYALITVLLLAACATRLQRAEKLMADGEPGPAISLYEDILEDDPDNDEAATGLRRARLQWISDTLIETRLTRMTGNIQGSIDLLRKVIAKENNWQVFPKGAVAFTQEEEADYASAAVERLIQNEIKTQHALKASLLFSEYGDFFQGAREFDGDRLETQIRDLGQATCGSLKSDLREDEYYFGQFIRRFCGYFGAAEPDLKKQLKFKNQNLYSRLEWQWRETELDEANRHILEQAALDGFKRSPWFDAEGKRPAPVNAGADFESRHEISNQTLTHSYSVSVPYTAEWTESGPDGEKSDLETALEVVSLLASLAGSKSKDRSEWDNGDGSRRVRETRYRDEARRFDYRALIHTQNFHLGFNGELKIGDKAVPLALSENFDHRSAEHATNSPDIGLYPQKAKLIGDADWIRTEAAKLSRQVEDGANRAWRETYCQENSTREQVFRCLRAGLDHLDLQEQRRFKDRYGIPLAQLDELFH